MENKTFYFGIDLETTGIVAEDNLILEAAAVILDDNLNEVWRLVTTIDNGTSVRSWCSEKVFNMHRSTGLLDADGNVTGDVMTTQEAEDTLVQAVEDLKPYKRPVLLGHSVHFDREFIEHHWPRLAALLHYRQVDARVPELLAPELWSRTEAQKAHRALDDILYSIEVVRKARNLLRAGATARQPATELILQRTRDLLSAGNPDHRPDLRLEVERLVADGDYSGAQAIAEHHFPFISYYLQGLRDVGAYDLDRARLLRQQAEQQCERMRKMYLELEHTTSRFAVELTDVLRKVD